MSFAAPSSSGDWLDAFEVGQMHQLALRHLRWGLAVAERLALDPFADVAIAGRRLPAGEVAARLRAAIAVLEGRRS